MKNMSKNSSEPCVVCGDIGFEDLIMTCFDCRNVRKHTYCAEICLMSRPNMWLCEVCRSSEPSRVDMDMQDLTTDHGASSSKISSELSGERSSYASPSKKRKEPFLAFPSPKRKPRTPRVPVDPEEVHDQGPRSSDPCVFHRTD